MRRSLTATVRLFSVLRYRTRDVATSGLQLEIFVLEIFVLRSSSCDLRLAIFVLRSSSAIVSAWRRDAQVCSGHDGIRWNGRPSSAASTGQFKPGRRNPPPRGDLVASSARSTSGTRAGPLAVV